MEYNADAEIIPLVCLHESDIEPEDTSSDEVITKPFDPGLIRVEPKPMTIDLLVNRIRENEIDMMPEFQRRAGIWKEDAQSRLIESLLIRFPLPAFYMDASDEDCWLVVDGLQRLTTIKRFVIDKSLKLVGLEFLSHLEGKTYDDLPRNFRRRISESQVTVYLIEKGTPPEVKFNIFKRINTGGLPLSAQEIRHALNQGPAAKLLEELATSEEFRHTTTFSVAADRMEDRECVLRYLAFKLSDPKDYTVKDLDSFLNDMMARMNKMSVVELNKLKSDFKRTMIAASVIFGNNAFRKKYQLNNQRFPINKALFESWTVNLDALSDESITKLMMNRDIVINKFMELMRDREFEASISLGTGNIRKVKKRFSSIKDLIAEVIND